MILSALDKIRYMKPFEKVADNWVWASVASFLSVLWSLIADIFVTDPALILLLFLAMCTDFITGVIASRRRNIRFSSVGMRQTLVKGIEYGVILLFLTGISNVYGSDGWVGSIVKQFDNFGYFFFTWIEVVSIAENFADEEGVIKKLFDKLKEKLNG